MARISTTNAFHFASQTVSTTALTLEAFTDITQTQVDQASRIRLTIEANTIRYRYDGTAPTASVGHLLAVGAELILVGAENIQKLQVIRASADASVMVTLEE